METSTEDDCYVSDMETMCIEDDKDVTREKFLNFAQSCSVSVSQSQLYKWKKKGRALQIFIAYIL